MLGALPFSTVNGRVVASFGEEYHYNGAPKSNSSVIPSLIKTLYKRFMMILCIVMKKSIKLSLINIVEILISQNTLITNQQSGHTPIFSLLRLVIPIVFKNKLTQEESKLEPVEGSLYAMSEYGVSTPLVTQD